MDIPTYLHSLTTEGVNPQSVEIDTSSSEEILRCINDQDQLVAFAVQKEIPRITQAVDLIYERLRHGGRLFYVGAGTSGRLGVLDASECPPTYGSDPEMVQGIIAGGDYALRHAVEGAEDDDAAGAAIIGQYHMSEKDALVGITASGYCRYVLGAARAARRTGVAVIGLVNNTGSPLEELCDVCITPIVGSEVVVGSTRMKAGTAAKLVLNMLSTAVMIKLGKVYGNLMVDLSANNDKLKDRSARIICRITSLDYEAAARYLSMAGGDTKLAVMMAKTGLSAQRCAELLERTDGVLKRALALAARPSAGQAL